MDHRDTGTDWLFIGGVAFFVSSTVAFAAIRSLRFRKTALVGDLVTFERASCGFVPNFPSAPRDLHV